MKSCPPGCDLIICVDNYRNCAEHLSPSHKKKYDDDNKMKITFIEIVIEVSKLETCIYIKNICFFVCFRLMLARCSLFVLRNSYDNV